MKLNKLPNLDDSKISDGNGKSRQLVAFNALSLIINKTDLPAPGIVLENFRKKCARILPMTVPKYYSLNSNVIVTYGYDCANGVDESIKSNADIPWIPCP